MKDLGVPLVLGMQVSRDSLKGTLDINQGNRMSTQFCSDTGFSTAEQQEHQALENP